MWTTTLATVAEALNGARIEWMLLGSAATALRGVAIVPGDIDIAVLTADDITHAAAVLPTPSEPPDPNLWFSTLAQPSLEWGDADERWYFGRWMINDVKVELAHIDAPDVADLMVETRSPLVWRERQTLTCHGHPIPTVPVEVQLATMMARHQHTRIDATITHAPLDRQLLRRAITDKQSEIPGLAVPEPLRKLLPYVGGMDIGPELTERLGDVGQPVQLFTLITGRGVQTAIRLAVELGRSPRDRTRQVRQFRSGKTGPHSTDISSFGTVVGVFELFQVCHACKSYTLNLNSTTSPSCMM